jgi:hypothetical protein
MAVFWDAMKYSRLISHVNIELKTNVLEPIINPVDGGRASIRNAGFNSSLTQLIVPEEIIAFNEVSDYRLSDRGSISDRGKGLFSSPCIQISSEAHQASLPMGTGGKMRPRRYADHSLHLVPRSRLSRSYITPLVACLAIAGQLYFVMEV